MHLTIFMIVFLLFPAITWGDSDGTNEPVNGDTERGIAIELIRRAESLKSNTRAFIGQHQAANHSHLLGAIEFELSLIEEVCAQLAAPNLTSPTYIHWLTVVHSLEDTLLYHENRLQEEFTILVETTLQTEALQESLLTLLLKARDLIPKAQEALKMYPNAREARALKHQLIQLEKLIIHLENHQNDLSDLVKAKEQLLRHDKTLATLLKRISESHVH